LGDKHPSDEKFSGLRQFSASLQKQRSNPVVAKLAYFFIRYLRSACAAITADPGLRHGDVNI
jgi:hypothetical protein